MDSNEEAWTYRAIICRREHTTESSYQRWQDERNSNQRVIHLRFLLFYSANIEIAGILLAISSISFEKIAQICTLQPLSKDRPEQQLAGIENWTVCIHAGNTDWRGRFEHGWFHWRCDEVFRHIPWCSNKRIWVRARDFQMVGWGHDLYNYWSCSSPVVIIGIFEKDE